MTQEMYQLFLQIEGWEIVYYSKHPDLIPVEVLELIARGNYLLLKEEIKTPQGTESADITTEGFTVQTIAGN